jgi:hypothetical protein
MGKSAFTHQNNGVQISTANSAPSVPLVGKWQTIYVPALPAPYDYTTQNQIAPGVWRLSKEQPTINGPATVDPVHSIQYITGPGTGTVLKIDPITGTVNWSTMTNVQSFNERLSSSQVLKDFSNYATGSLAYSFAVSDELKKGVNTSKSNILETASASRLSMTVVTGVPEPAEWLLLIVGAGLLSWRLHRRPVYASQPLRTP